MSERKPFTRRESGILIRAVAGMIAENHKTVACECEHIAHMGEGCKTPNGNPGHRYGQKFFPMVMRRHPHTKEMLCPDCERDCRGSL